MVLTITFKFSKDSVLETAVKELGKMEQDKIVLKTGPPVLYLQNPAFGIKVFTKNKKLCTKINVKRI